MGLQEIFCPNAHSLPFLLLFVTNKTRHVESCCCRSFVGALALLGPPHSPLFYLKKAFIIGELVTCTKMMFDGIDIIL